MEDLDLDSTKVTAHTKKIRASQTSVDLSADLRKIQADKQVRDTIRSEQLLAQGHACRWRNSRRWREGWMPSGRLLRWIGCSQSLIGDFPSPFLEEEMGMKE
jgi:hypothetical protein